MSFPSNESEDGTTPFPEKIRRKFDDFKKFTEDLFQDKQIDKENKSPEDNSSQGSLQFSFDGNPRENNSLNGTIFPLN